jgi:PadR family transcriptional regulator PadR
VASYYGNETFGKRRTYYKITKEGRTLYQSKCKEWAQAKTVIDRFVVEEEKENGSD